MFYLLHFWCSTLNLVKSAQHCPYNYSRYTLYMWSDVMLILWNRISTIFYKDRECCLHILPKQHHFLTSWTLNITSLLNLNENQRYHHLDLSMIQGFHGFAMFSLSLSNIGWFLFRNAKETLQKMLDRKCSYRGKHMKDYSLTSG